LDIPGSALLQCRRGDANRWEFRVVRSITVLALLAAFAAAAPAHARDMTLPKATADELKAACAKAGGKFSQGGKIYGCGTDCNGKPGTDCTVDCVEGQRCTTQVIGGRRPHSVAEALTKPGRR
jgi:hypothetical protein